MLPRLSRVEAQGWRGCVRCSAWWLVSWCLVPGPVLSNIEYLLLVFCEVELWEPNQPDELTHVTVKISRYVDMW